MSGKISAEMIKELRDRTGVSMSKCKEALEQSSGNMDAAIDFLRKTGMASAVKKEGREANEGLIGHAESAQAVALVEVNTETDFVAQNEKFKQFLKDICMEAAKHQPSSLEAFLKQTYSNEQSLTIDEYRALTVQSLGENIQIKRFTLIPKSADVSVGVYSHMGGKIVTVVVLGGGSGQEALSRDLAMHVAAESPDFLKPEDVPQDVKAKEEEIARSQIQGKPANIVDKIVEGKIKAYYDQVCLVCQKYIKDNSKTITDVLHEESKRLGKTLTLLSFLRWKVGA